MLAGGEDADASEGAEQGERHGGAECGHGAHRSEGREPGRPRGDDETVLPVDGTPAPRVRTSDQDESDSYQELACVRPRGAKISPKGKPEPRPAPHEIC